MREKSEKKEKGEKSEESEKVGSKSCFYAKDRDLKSVLLGKRALIII